MYACFVLASTLHQTTSLHAYFQLVIPCARVWQGLDIAMVLRQDEDIAHAWPSLASTLGLLELISKGTLALVSGCRFFLMEILGLVFFALRSDLPMPLYEGCCQSTSRWLSMEQLTECGCTSMAAAGRQCNCPSTPLVIVKASSKHPRATFW